MAQDAEGGSSLIGPILLVMATVFGFILSNSPLSESYEHLIHTMIQFQIGSWEVLNKSASHMINDGLMAIFFLFVGLELKREIVVGELSDMKKASLPIFAAIGGMAVPAIIYSAFNLGTDALGGWGIPMATDIAFAIGILAVLGSRVPTSLKVLLTAVAIVDDLGAILVIALFYTTSIKMAYLAGAFAVFFICFAMNRAGVRQLSLYLLLGIPMWYCMLKSGVHATIAGVMLAAAIPLVFKGEDHDTVLTDIFNNDRTVLDSPGVFLEKSLARWVSFIIIPIFAFFNAGVSLSSLEFTHVSFGVIFGLLFGKPIGIFLLSYIATKLNMGFLPEGVSWTQLIGVGFLAGIGFTMSLFINSLAFGGADYGAQAKAAILIGSILAAIVGAIILTKTAPRSKAQN